MNNIIVDMGYGIVGGREGGKEGGRRVESEREGSCHTNHYNDSLVKSWMNIPRLPNDVIITVWIIELW